VRHHQRNTHQQKDNTQNDSETGVDDYIKQRKDQQDTRKYMVHITQKIRHLQNKLLKIIIKWNHIILKRFIQYKQKTIITNLKRMIKKAHDKNRKEQDA